MWQKSWLEISKAIEDLANSTKLYFDLKKTHDYKEIGRFFKPTAKHIVDKLRLLKNLNLMPEGIINILQDQLFQHENILKFLEVDRSYATDNEIFISLLISLNTLKIQIDLYVNDFEEKIESSTERALVHLNRCIEVDPDIRKKWISAEHETECERLGSVHLLHHKIWAVKVNSEGQRTDLLAKEFNEENIYKTGSSLVLTEWKITEDNNVVQKSKGAYTQLKRYSSGVLYGYELEHVKYIILVSKKHLKNLPSDMTENSIVYRHINIITDPSVPSRQI